MAIPSGSIAFIVHIVAKQFEDIAAVCGEGDKIHLSFWKDSELNQRVLDAFARCLQRSGAISQGNGVWKLGHRYLSILSSEEEGISLIGLNYCEPMEIDVEEKGNEQLWPNLENIELYLSAGEANILDVISELSREKEVFSQVRRSGDSLEVCFKEAHSGLEAVGILEELKEKCNAVGATFHAVLNFQDENIYSGLRLFHIQQKKEDEMLMLPERSSGALGSLSLIPTVGTGALEEESSLLSLGESDLSYAEEKKEPPPVLPLFSKKNRKKKG